MRLYTETDDFKLYEGNMLDLGEVIQPETVDSIVTDPPYELNFMSKGWDRSGIAFQTETWRRLFEVLKPGGYLLAFGGSRTFHRIATAIEDAGFEIRDVVLWLYGSGFPKSLDIGLAIDKKLGVESEVIGERIKTESWNYKNNNVYVTGGDADKVELPIKKASNEWAGWGTALKPAYEPVIVARKPCAGSCIENVLSYRVGGLNIDECRIGEGEGGEKHFYPPNYKNQIYGRGFGGCKWENTNGRFPSNVILTYDDGDADEVIGGMPDSKSTRPSTSDNRQNLGSSMFIDGVHTPGNSYDDEGSAARYFYTAKASKKDRDEGLEAFKAVRTGSMAANINGPMTLGAASLKNEPKEIQPKRNIHPTVKPTDLMQYLVRLVTPKGGTVLDPFNGSGSTGKAVMFENRERGAGYKYIGIELTPEYLPIAEARIRWAAGVPLDDVRPEEKQAGQVSIFDILGGAQDATG